MVLFFICNWYFSGYDSEKELQIDGKNQWLAISEGYSSPREHLVVDIDEQSNMTAVVLDKFKYLQRMYSISFFA